MKGLSKQVRLILSIAILILCVVLSWGLADYLGGLSMLFFIPGGFAFVLLNPELMRGE